MEDTECAANTQHFDVQICSTLGSELVDIVNVLRGLNTPEDDIRKTLINRCYFAKNA
jgi:hypothetical protein